MTMSQPTSLPASPIPAIRYVTGDATDPVGSGHRVIAHVCNDAGGWGRGFVVALSRRWPQPEAAYRRWSRSQERFELGMVQLVAVAADLSVANLVAQHGYASATNPMPLRYDALETCLGKLARRATSLGASVHLPRIGTGLAGGSWDQVAVLLERTLLVAGVETVVYDLPTS